MKALVLAAGRGERLMPLTKDCPKPLVDLGGGRTLLDEQALAMHDAGCIDEAVFIVGYKAEQVEHHITRWRHASPALRTVFNPFYPVSNNLMSLWIARGEMQSDFIVTNGDNLFTADVYARLVHDASDGITLALSPKRHFDDDDMKAAVRRGRVVAVSKTLDARRCRAESPGLVVVRGGRARRTFAAAVERLARDTANLTRFWLEVFNHLAARRVQITPWYFDGASEWQEIDFHGDMAAAQALLAGKLARLRAGRLRRAA